MKNMLPDWSLDHRPDLQLIARLVPHQSRVLDIACGDGLLLHYLTRSKKIDGRGIELDPAKVSTCVQRGLSVIQGDADIDLAHYPNHAFDVAVLGTALQMMQKPKDVLQHMVRIAQRTIVAIPNFGYWRNRWHLMVHGRMPVTGSLPYAWYETPNIHFCTLKDFERLTQEMGLKIHASYSLDAQGHVGVMRNGLFKNALSEKAVFVLEKH
jgi:methionine biosynthesis protein MetW